MSILYPVAHERKVHSLTRRRLAAAALLVVLQACGGGGDEVSAMREQAAAAPTLMPDYGPNVVSLWSKASFDTVISAIAVRVTPEERRTHWPVDMAAVHAAMYDAAMAISRTHKPYAIEPLAPAEGASIDAAVGAAAHGVLRALFPNRAAVFQPVYDAWLASLPDDEARARGLALGAEVAAGIVALRADDGRWSVLDPLPQGTLPGEYRSAFPTVPFGPAIKPFAIQHTAQFRAEGPPALNSSTYAQEWQEVVELGGAISTRRTPAQTDAARFHSEFPPYFWSRNLRRFMTSQPTVAANARMGAMFWVVAADTVDGCFESKFHFYRWRPVTAVVLADTDGNDATTADPGWTPSTPTVPNPEYPAGHTCFSGAVAETLRQAFGTRKLSFDLDSAVTGTAQHYDSIDAMEDQVADTGIWGGREFRTSLVHGRVLGMQTAKYVLRHYFQARE